MLKRRVPIVLCLLFSVLLVAPTRAQDTPLTTERIATGFAKPLQAVAPPGDVDRLFIVEQDTARIKIIDLRTNTVLGTPFLDINAKVNDAANERGLLGLAFHPDYENNGYFYVNYTRQPDSATVVERYTVSANPDIADSTSAKLILGPISQPFSNHNGGCIQFSPTDGYLYIGMGDGGSSNDPQCRAQKGDTLHGKMLRIDVDGGDPYAIPPDNPYVNDEDILDEIWHFGLRNPWRFSFDRATGDMYIGDVGQNAREEIDYQADGAGGLNYGWKVMEGLLCNSTSNCPVGQPACNDPIYTNPIRQRTHGGGRCSITGGYMYRGCAIPDLRGSYFYADYCSNQIWSFRFDGVSLSDQRDRTAELDPACCTINSITSFGEDGRGELYIVDQGGEIFRIIADAPPPAIDLGFGKVGSNGLTPELSACGLLDSGNEAQFNLRFAPASTPAFLAVSDQFNPTPLFGGTIVPIPWILLVGLQTDSEGEINLVGPGGSGPFTLYLQYLLVDPGASFGIGFSNAIQADWQP